MPYASDAQRRYFHAAEARGDIKPSTVREFDKASKGMSLPEHVKEKKMSMGGDVKCMHCGGMTPMSDGGEVRDNEDGPLGDFDVHASEDMPGGEGEEMGDDEREKMMRYGKMLMGMGSMR